MTRPANPMPANPTPAGPAPAGPTGPVPVAGGPRRWREAMDRALYGQERGFFVSGAGPAAHFRTSVHASPLFTAAVLDLLATVDGQLGHPDPLDVVDIGAGRGELLCALAGTAPAAVRDRLRLTAVELAPRPPDLPDAIAWRDSAPAPVRGLLLANEWLDNVPLDVAVPDGSGGARYLLVDDSGEESLGPAVDAADARWLRRWWWPERGAATAGTRAEIGLPRDRAWASAVASVERGLAVAIDYGHPLEDRPPAGTLTGFRDGRETAPVPDGSCDLTAHVAIDAVAAAGRAAAGGAPPVLCRQRAALHQLGVSGARPSLDLAARDPAAYVRALAAASQAAELTDLAGLGGHFWLLQPIRMALSGWDATTAGVAPCRA
jgi:SAM-dependent MidA family methyltransferase